jgi:hypothetical protein
LRHIVQTESVVGFCLKLGDIGAGSTTTGLEGDLSSVACDKSIAEVLLVDWRE